MDSKSITVTPDTYVIINFDHGNYDVRSHVVNENDFNKLSEMRTTLKALEVYLRVSGNLDMAKDINDRFFSGEDAYLP
jgi:hypothetical protein